MNNYMFLAKKNECTGCTACMSACPVNAITMKADNTGFLFPIIDENVCVKCGICSKVCPVINSVVKEKEFYPKAYIVQNKDDKVRFQSTSGGFFSLIAEEIIKLGGVVFGASYDKNFVVCHSYVTKVEDLSKFRNSKYVQSEVRNTYFETKMFLKNQRLVCYSGTPCQIAGLLNYLGEKYDNLVTIDLVCHSVPSPLIFKKYIEYQSKKYGIPDTIVFRDKTLGYSFSTMAFYKKNISKSFYREGSESDIWFRAFLGGFCDRDSCYNCTFQKWPRNSDFTIWDCFKVNKLNKNFDDNKGTTSAIAWTDKAQNIILSLNKEKVNLFSISSPEVFRSKIQREKFKKMSINRETMYKDANIMDPISFFEKYFKINIQIRAKRMGKKVLYKIGLYNFVRRFF